MADEIDFDPSHFNPGHLHGFQSQFAIRNYNEIGSRESHQYHVLNWQRRIDDADEFVKATEAGDRIYKLEALDSIMKQIRDGKQEVELVNINGNDITVANLTMKEYEQERKNPGKLMHGTVYSNTGIDFISRWSPLWRTVEFTDRLVPWQFRIKLAQSWNTIDIRDCKSGTEQRDSFALTEEEFRQSAEYKRLLARLKEERVARNLDDCFKIKNIVCFALGSPVRMQIGLPLEPRIQKQHAFALALKEEFSATVCYTQDPEYSNTDQKILEEKGMKVVKDPEGFKQIDNDSIVFFISPNTDVWAIMADNCRPAIIICYPRIPNGKLPAYDSAALRAVTALQDPGEYVDWIERFDPEIQYQKRVRYMAHREYDEVTLTETPGGMLPEDDVNHPEMKPQLMMYIRKPGTEWQPETWRNKAWLEEFTI
ncbi:hypothetical protein VM1G_04954 [Cytospora mali]|uniref:SRR1-like domain-containing protein n=1 Tax=Cytospora mali TaxID=578113 RepID=A0A194VYW2_CYTMA|nr:hypothetical protein VM1G_04954 [Valsa mali]